MALGHATCGIRSPSCELPKSVSPVASRGGRLALESVEKVAMIEGVHNATLGRLNDEHLENILHNCVH